MKVSDFVIKFLLDNGIDTAFTISGGGCIHLIDSLRKSDMDVFCPHHEQSALMAAEGYTRMNGKMCASIVTTGPGGTNALTGLLGLWLDSIPSIIISGQVPINQISYGTGCRQIGDQEFDIISTVKNMTKYSVMITDPNKIYYELEKAYKISNSGRPGPVWIDIPLDIQGADINLDGCERYKDEKIDVSINKEDIKKFTEMINESKRPLVIVGNGINLSRTNEQLNDFLNKTGIPVVTGPHSGIDAVDNTYDYYAGRIGILGQLSSNTIVQNSDLLICLGTRLPVKMTGYNINEFSPNSKKIMVDIDNNEISKHKFKIDLKLNIDLNTFFEDIKNIQYKDCIYEWQDYVKKLRIDQKYYHKKHMELKDYASFYYFISKCSDVFDKTPIVTSNGTAHVVTLQNYKINKDQKLFTNVGCASMGYGLPAAIGACIANNKKQVICIEGDGSIMMNIQELQTIVGYKLPVKTIIVNNDGYLSIKLTQESFFDGKEFASGKDNGVTIPNFKSISHAFGIPYNSIKTNAEIDDMLDWFIKQENSCILEVFTHPKERHEPKVTHKGLDENGKIIPGTLMDMFISETF